LTILYRWKQIVNKFELSIDFIDSFKIYITNQQIY